MMNLLKKNVRVVNGSFKEGRKSARLYFFAFLIFVLAILAAGCSSESKPNGDRDGVLLGVFHEGSQKDLGSIVDMEKTLSKKFASIMWYMDWSSSFPGKDAERVSKAGYMPHITWEPWFFNDKEKVKLDDILSGKWDNYISTWAKDAAKFGKPMFLRWGHEFNGNWYPWSLALNGENSEKYVAAYKKIHDLFKKAGADNVLWIWCANATSLPNQPWNAPLEAYPGDEYVDWIAIDGYNSSGMDSFRTIFAKTYTQLVTKINKPIMIAEFATGGKGKDKADWITQMSLDIKDLFPAVRAITWFDINKELDWRLLVDKESSDAAKTAFASDYFLSDSKLFKPIAEAYSSRRASYLTNIEALVPARTTKESSAVELPAGARLGQTEQALASVEPLKLASSGGQEDLSAEVRFGWNKDALFFKAVFEDDMPAFNNKTGKDIWNGDCLEICLGLDEKADPAREYIISDDFQIGFSPGSAKDSVKPSVWGWGSLSAAPKDADIKLKVNEKGYEMEGMIPWNSIRDGFVPAKGMKLGFDFAIDDADSSGDRKTQSIWNGDSNFYSNPSQWGTLLIN